MLGDGFNFAVRSNAYYEFISMCNLSEVPDEGGNPNVARREFDIMFNQVTYQDKSLLHNSKNVARYVLQDCML